MTLNELKEMLDEQYCYEELLPANTVTNWRGTDYTVAFKMVAYQVCLTVSITEEKTLCCDVHLRDQTRRMFCFDSPEITINLTNDKAGFHPGQSIPAESTQGF